MDRGFTFLGQQTAPKLYDSLCNARLIEAIRTVNDSFRGHTLIAVITERDFSFIVRELLLVHGLAVGKQTLDHAAKSGKPDIVQIVLESIATQNGSLAVTSAACFA